MGAAPFPSPTETWHTSTYPSISPTLPSLSAKGKTILITGGGTGIGAETALSFAKAGASRIALLGRRIAPLKTTKAAILQISPHCEVFIASVDITARDSVFTAFNTFASEGKAKIDVLVSNAATVGPHESVADVNGDAFLGAINQNLAGSLYVAQAFLRHAAPDAVAIDINSSAAHLDFSAGLASYSVAKMAIVRMWDSLALGAPEISVFHVQPGIIATDMNKEAGGIEAIGFQDDVSLPGSFNVWVASPEARFLKGKFLWANWDVDELKARAEELREGTQLSIGLVGWPFGDAGFKVNWKN